MGSFITTKNQKYELQKILDSRNQLEQLNLLRGFVLPDKETESDTVMDKVFSGQSTFEEAKDQLIQHAQDGKARYTDLERTKATLVRENAQLARELATLKQNTAWATQIQT